MSAATELNAAKKNLAEILGDSMKLYLQILKSWFRQKISRDDFDHEARKMLPSESVHLHNQFLLAILTKCQTIGSTIVQKDPNAAGPPTQSSPQKPKKIRDKDKKRAQCPRVTFHQRFITANPLTQVPLIQQHIHEPEEKGPAYVSREMLLPDVGLVHGRMIVSAWDYGLDDVEDDAVRLLLQAVEMQLKNILSAVVSRQNGYHLKEKRVRCSFGTERAPSLLQNTALVTTDFLDSESTSVSSKGVHMPTVRPSVESGLRDAAVQIATGSVVPRTKENINLFDLYDTLQIQKSAIPSHSVYSLTMERITSRLFHSSNEELLQDDIHRQEIKLKREIYAQQSVFRT